MEKPALKAVFISYNQSLTDKVEYMLDLLGIRGYTQWENIKGRGSVMGEPHLGTHTWPEINSSVLAIVEEDTVGKIMETVKKIDEVNTEVGIRVFVWDVTATY
jgi:nitrogen regulatory protein PII